MIGSHWHWRIDMRLNHCRRSKKILSFCCKKSSCTLILFNIQPIPPQLPTMAYLVVGPCCGYRCVWDPGHAAPGLSPEATWPAVYSAHPQPPCCNSCCPRWLFAFSTSLDQLSVSVTHSLCKNANKAVPDWNKTRGIKHGNQKLYKVCLWVDSTKADWWITFTSQSIGYIVVTC